MGKYIFFHIFTDGPYENVITEMMDLCMKSGILDDINQLFYYVVGHYVDNVKSIMSRYPKTNLVNWDRNGSRQYERFTLHDMHHLAGEYVHKEDPCYFLYIHSKGVSKKSYRHHFVHVWRQTMLDALVTYRETCWKQLDDGVDVIGCFFRHHPAKHYSGNFWWTTPRYIRSLPTPIGRNYLDPEMWIGRSMALAATIFEAHHNLYNYCPSIHEYRPHVNVQHHLSHRVPAQVLNSVSWENVRLVECGLNQTWVPCRMPPAHTIGSVISMNASEFPLVEGTDPFLNMKKQFRIWYHRSDASSATFLENTPAVRIPHEKHVAMDDVTQCLYAKQSNPSESQDLTHRIRRPHLRYRTCILNNDFFGSDPFRDEEKVIIFRLSNGKEQRVNEQQYVFFV